MYKVGHKKRIPLIGILLVSYLFFAAVLNPPTNAPISTTGKNINCSNNFINFIRSPHCILIVPF